MTDNYPRASALGIALFAVMFATLSLYRVMLRGGQFATITGKAFRPRTMAMGRLAWVLFAACLAYVIVAAFPSMKALKDWYASPEYAAAFAFRAAAVKRRMIFVAGVHEPAG